MFTQRCVQPVPDSSEGEEGTHYFCRICFEDAKPSELISPCKCKGTLKYVHQTCLHKWQANVQKLGGKSDERATICGVCRTRYTVLPPKAALYICRKVWALARSLAGAACISLLALCLSGPPCLHLALLLLLLLGSRSQSLLAGLLLLLGCLMGSLYARGLRLVVRTEGDMRFGLALIRHGAPVEGLRPGALLVAHQTSLEGTMFAQAVVLITEKSSRGAKGVMLTQPMETVDSQLWNSHQLNQHLPTINNPLRHYLGGPVGLPSSTGPASQTVVLHHIPSIPGAATLIGAPAAAAAASATADAFRAGLDDESAAMPQLQLQQPARMPALQRLLQRCKTIARRHQFSNSLPGAAAASAAGIMGGDTDNAAAAAAAASTADTAGRTGSSIDQLGLYYGGSIELLLQAVLAASNAAAGAAAAAAAQQQQQQPRSSLASKLRWQPHNRSPGNMQQTSNNSSNSNNSSSNSSSSSSSAEPWHSVQQQQQQQQQQQLRSGELASLAAAVRMYHGVCAWAAGQLEGEVRAGAWGVVQAQLDDVIMTPPQQLWEVLLHSDRAHWFAS